MSKKRIFIGVAWPYVNGELHVGHLAGYLIPADICARFHRYIGDDVLMVSGSDCHGTPITVEAEKKNITPQQVVALYHPKHQKLFSLYQLSFDIYTKTTTANHQKVVQQMFVKLAKNGYIYKDVSQQYFSPEEKRFLPDRYVQGTCPFCHSPQARGDQCDQCGKVLRPGELIKPHSKLTGKAVSLKKTEHYYFDLPKLAPFLKKYVARKGPSWRSWVYQETLGWLKKGLEARSITRDLEWGIKIPVRSLPPRLRLKEAEHKRIYVWFEAVIGYLSASQEWAGKSKRWRDFWYSSSSATHYYFMGKDNLVFHTLFWPAQLYGAFGSRIHLPDYPVINHFLNLEGHKFSKSRNISVSSQYLGEKYGVDPVRFYVTLIMPETADANFSWSHFVEVNNHVLIDTLGNFINRTLNLSRSLAGFSPAALEESVVRPGEKLLQEARERLANCEFKAYVQAIIELAQRGNKYINQQAPWKLERKSAEFKKVMTNALWFVLAIHLGWEPLIPGTNQKLAKMLGIQLQTWPKEKVGEYLAQFLPRVKISSVKPLFKKIDPAVVTQERAKLSLS